MSSWTQNGRSSVASGSQDTSKASIDLTDDTEEKGSAAFSLPTFPDLDTPTRILTTEVVDLSSDDDDAAAAEDSPSSCGTKKLKRRTDWKPELTAEDYTKSNESKRCRHEYKVTTDDGESSELTEDDRLRHTTLISKAKALLARSGGLTNPIFIDDDEADMIAGPEEDEEIIDVDDFLSDDDDIQFVGQRRCQKEKKKRKVHPILVPSRQRVNHVKINGIDVDVGCCFEFHDGTFMKVCAIYHERHHETMLVGKVFTRITEREALMPNLRASHDEWKPSRAEICKIPLYHNGFKLINEVCQRIKIPAGEANQDEGLWRRPAREVKRLRTLIMTNQSYEDNSMTNQHMLRHVLDEQSMEAEGELTCRWKEIITNDEYGKVKEHRLERPSGNDDELSRGHVAEGEGLRTAWRGSTLNVAASKTKPTMIEACCGAGGMTMGAQEAGIDTRIAFDIDPAKIATHRLNFPTCKSMKMDIFDWIQWAEHRNLKVDILHLSPPCQPFSPACTTPNLEKKEIYEAVLLACGEVIKLVRPRIVTIEESDGLLNRHSKWFGALISQFTELGFSIRWACLKCNDFGVPQSRKRLFLIASAPGEDLPTFPEPTHEPGTVSIQKTLDELEAAHRISPLKYHDPEARNRLSKPAYDANCCAKTITCKGGDNYHPSGERDFTIQEYLELQTFLRRFRFPEMIGGKPITRTEMKIQIGNAVPPLAGIAILSNVMKSILASDEKRLERFGGADETDAITL